MGGIKITDYGFGYCSAYEIKERRNLTSVSVVKAVTKQGLCWENHRPGAALALGLLGVRSLQCPLIKSDVTVLGVLEPISTGTVGTASATSGVSACGRAEC